MLVFHWVQFFHLTYSVTQILQSRCLARDEIWFPKMLIFAISDILKLWLFKRKASPGSLSISSVTRIWTSQPTHDTRPVQRKEFQLAFRCKKYTHGAVQVLSLLYGIQKWADGCWRASQGRAQSRMEESWRAVPSKRQRNKGTSYTKGAENNHKFYYYYVNLLFVHISLVCPRDQVTAHH